MYSLSSIRGRPLGLNPQYQSPVTMPRMGQIVARKWVSVKKSLSSKDISVLNAIYYKACGFFWCQSWVCQNTWCHDQLWGGFHSLAVTCFWCNFNFIKRPRKLKMKTFLFSNTPGTAGGPGGHDRTLALKNQKTVRKSFFFAYIF